MLPSTQISQLPVCTDYKDVWTMATNSHNQSVRLNCNQVLAPIQQAIDSVRGCQTELANLRTYQSNSEAYINWSRQILDSHNVYSDCCETHNYVASGEVLEHSHSVPLLQAGHTYYLHLRYKIDPAVLQAFPTIEQKSDITLYTFINGVKKYIMPLLYISSADVVEENNLWTSDADYTDNTLSYNFHTANEIVLTGYTGNVIHIDYARLYDLSVAPTETLQSLHDSISSLNRQVYTLTTERNKWKKMYEDHMSTHSSSSGGGTTTTGNLYIKCYDCGYEWGPFNSEADARTKEQQLNSDLGKKDICDENHSGDEGYTHIITYVYQK